MNADAGRIQNIAPFGILPHVCAWEMFALWCRCLSIILVGVAVGSHQFSPPLEWGNDFHANSGGVVMVLSW